MRGHKHFERERDYDKTTDVKLTHRRGEMEDKIKTKKAQSGSMVIACLLLIIITLLIAFTGATPTGADGINITSNETKALTDGKIVNISGGMIAKMNISATMQNPHWKAFVGWIDGAFTLNDATG